MNQKLFSYIAASPTAFHAVATTAQRLTEYGFTDLLQGEYRENLARDCGDFILRRSDGVYAYQLAVVVDDALMGVTQVVRGEDLLDSTPRQLWLQEVLGLPHPAYGHGPLLLAPDGRRLAKRDRDLELGQLRETYTAPELVGRLAFAAGLLPEYAPVTPRELLPLFNWDRVPRGDMVCSLPADGKGPEIYTHPRLIQTGRGVFFIKIKCL